MITWALITFAWLWFAFSPPPLDSSLMEFSGISNISPNALCPGETLNYSLDLHVAGPGVYAIDESVWQITPRATVLFSETRRIVFSAPTDYVLERQWTITPFVTNSTTDMVIVWKPGKYERRLAISTVSRATNPSIVVVPFVIREDCQP